MVDSDIPRRAGRPLNARFQAPPRPPEPVVDGDGKVLRRRRQRSTDDVFAATTADKAPEGWTYEFKRESVFGKPDTRHQIGLRENGWRPVPASRHPEMMPEGYDPDGPIRIDGQMLMERPEYLTQEAREEDHSIAMGEVDKVRASQMGTPAGTFSRSHPSAQRVSGVKVSYGPAPMTVED